MSEDLLKMYKWVHVIQGVSMGLTASKIQRETNITYCHVVKIITKLEEQGYLNRGKIGRKKVLALTKEGEELAKLTLQVNNVLAKTKR